MRHSFFLHSIQNNRQWFRNQSLVSIHCSTECRVTAMWHPKIAVLFNAYIYNLLHLCKTALVKFSSAPEFLKFVPQLSSNHPELVQMSSHQRPLKLAVMEIVPYSELHPPKFLCEDIPSTISSVPLHGFPA